MVFADYRNKSKEIVIVGQKPYDLEISKTTNGNIVMSESLSQPVVIAPGETVRKEYDISGYDYSVDSLSQFQIRLEVNYNVFSAVDSTRMMQRLVASSNSLTVRVKEYADPNVYSAFKKAATVDLISAADPQAAVHAYSEFLSTHPGSSLETRVLSRLFMLYLNSEDDENAAAVATQLLEEHELPAGKLELVKYI